MKRNVFCKTLVRLSLMCLLFIAIPQRSIAQGDAEKANFTGKGLDIASDITFADLVSSMPNIDDADASRVLFYNVGKDMFLNSGGFWGTRTATFTVGLPVVISRTRKGILNQYYVYNFRGPFTNSAGFKGAGSLLAFVNDTGTKRGVFWDRGTNSDANINYPDWRFEEVPPTTKNGLTADDGKVYRIYVTVGNNTYYLCSGCAMSVNVFKKGNDNLVRAVTDTELEDSGLPIQNTYWKLTKERALEESFVEDYEGATLADATFLLRAQDFNISNIYNIPDNTLKYGRGWLTEGKVQYETSFSAAFPGLDTGSLYDALTPNFGMFQCAGLRNAEAGSKLYQKVTLSKPGWYMIECQGLYNDANGQECYANLYAKFLNDDGSEPNKNSVAWATTPLLGKSYAEANKIMDEFEATLKPETFQDLRSSNLNCPENDTYRYLLVDGIGDRKISNKVEAGVAFYSKLYPNQVMIYANIESGKTKVMEIGVELPNGLTTNNDTNADAAENEYVYVDDFRVKYLGESFALSDEWNDFKVAGNEETDKADYTASYTQKAMVFKRDLTTGMWNSICLPVDLQKWQLRSAFSAEVKLSRMKETPVKDGRIEFELVDIDGAAEDDVVLKRGECYLIKPGTGSLIEDESIVIGNLNNNNVLPPYYIIPKVTLKKEDMANVIGIDDKSVFYNRFHSLDYNRDGSEVYVRNKSYKLSGTKYQECNLDLYATFENEAEAPANSYVFVGGQLYHIKNPYKVPGYSWWIADTHQDPTQVGTKARRHLLGADYDGATGIEEIESEFTVRESAPAVYNLWGQAVRRGTTSLSGLPNGIYVVNGKKVTVR